MNQFSSSKILRHLERIVEWRKTGISRPITYELDMTNLCNSQCPFCFGFKEREQKRESLDLASAKNIILQIKKYGGKGITFTGGGEPLCNPATPGAVLYARKLGLDVGFITNGIALTPDISEKLVDSCTWIRVSLDAGKKEVYRQTHGMNDDTFQRVIANIKELVNIKTKKRSAVTIGTGFITYPEILGDMVNFTQLSKECGVDYAQFRPLLKRFDQREINITPQKEVLAELEKCLLLSNGKFKVVCSTHKYGSMINGCVERKYAQCYGHNFAAVIAANRKMYLCCHMRGNEKYCLGDLKKKTLEEIWRSKKRKQVYERIDFADCPLMCRCDGFNTLLWTISRKSEHENFL